MSRQGSSGLTLVEVLVVLSISGLLVTAATAVINRTFSLSPKTDARLLALRQVQNAGNSISRDLAMAQNVIFDDPGTGEEELITLSWTGWPVKVDPEQASSDSRTLQHRVAYYLTDDNELRRTHTITTTIADAYGIEQSASESTTETMIAQHIISSDDPNEPGTKFTDCYRDESEEIIVFKVKAEVRGESASRVYRARPRSAS